MVKKKFPVHLRDSFSVFCSTEVSESALKIFIMDFTVFFCSGDRETIRNYIKNYSQLLSYAPRSEL